ncbi:MAG: hypothetical protein KF729_34315 [Sandaracinaceae bacterium]|nr:hypothetical protein [Sandaracinaceae bacterium]
MDEIGTAYLVMVGTLSLLLAGAAVATAWMTHERWLGAPGRRLLQGGAFRSAGVTTPPRRQVRRFVVLGAAGLMIAWSLLTFFFFAPAGMLAALVATAGELGVTRAWFWRVLGVAALDALPLTILTIAAAFLLVSRSDQAARLGTYAAIWGAVHHAALIALGLGYELSSSVGEGLGVFTAVAAALGLALSALSATAALLTRRDV